MFHQNNSSNGTLAAPEFSAEQTSAYYDDTPGNAEMQRLFVKLETLRNGSQKHRLLITSAVLGEGKSTISSHIAMTSARNRGRSTLLVDFDLRRPTQHQLFNLNKEIGVAEVLGQRKTFVECIKDTFIDNLKVMTSGALDTSPLEVFNAENARAYFEEAQKHFDYIIVDSPPVVPVSDPLTLSKVVDNVVFVVKAGQTSRKVVKRALETLQSAQIEVLGLIMNNVDSVLPAYLDPKYYDYQYYTYK